MNVDLVAATRCEIGESPVWHVAEQALYWVDIRGKALWRLDPATGVTRRWSSPESIGCIAPHANGGWIAAMQSGVFHLRTQANGTLACDRLAEVKHPERNMRFNDGRCDRQGRFWSGTMVEDTSAARAAGRLYRFTQDEGLQESMLNGFVTINGMAFAPDGRTMYLSDSHPTVRRVWSFDYGIDEGRPSGRREFIDMHRYPGRPDGAAVDAEGCYWICAADAGAVHRFDPHGRLDFSIALPVSKPTMCAFGGAQLDTLFITSIRPVGIELSDQPEAGGVFAVRPGVCGLSEPWFGR